MYARRNTLTILILLVLLTAMGFLWYRREARELDRVSGKNKQLTMQLRGALEVAETLAKVTAERDSLQVKWQRAPKKILNTQEPAFSLSYINWLIQVHQLDLDFDFYLNEKKTRNEYTVFSYTINGEGSYRNICSLIWYMTHNPLIYQIKSVNFKRSDNDPKLVNFVIMFEGYSMTKEWAVSSEVAMTSPAFNWETEFSWDAFAALLPTVAEAKPVAAVTTSAAPVAPPKPKEPPGLIDAESSTLLAITNDRAYLRARDGKVVPLRIGDPVRRGRLTRLNPQRNDVEFELETESGSTRVLRLQIEYN
ncbi:MAG: hypothetical protein ONB44_01995 [candidate division KSB1 bacterium]|nr:hypothetical protein [candidate division KSB1 bacterium]MDZ7300894.1 hypothetical protein [candidate division KSB1 bacterium]MDZ7309836.1 hypothetical protein [candidate division KSB1 bacterium]